MLLITPPDETNNKLFGGWEIQISLGFAKIKVSARSECRVGAGGFFIHMPQVSRLEQNSQGGKRGQLFCFWGGGF